MTTFTVWKFDDPNRAEQAAKILHDAAADGLVKIVDHAVVTWPDQRPEPDVLWALAGLGLLCTAVAFLVFYALIREVGPARATVFTYVNPAVAVLAGVLLLGEPLTPLIVVAFGAILAGSVLATSGGAPGPVAGPLPAPEPHQGGRADETRVG